MIAFLTERATEEHRRTRKRGKAAVCHKVETAGIRFQERLESGRGYREEGGGKGKSHPIDFRGGRGKEGHIVLERREDGWPG